MGDMFEEESVFDPTKKKKKKKKPLDLDAEFKLESNGNDVRNNEKTSNGIMENTDAIQENTFDPSMKKKKKKKAFDLDAEIGNAQNGKEGNENGAGIDMHNEEKAKKESTNDDLEDLE